MQRSLHVLVIWALLPGVILPGQTALCLCAAVACSECGTCCAQGRAVEEGCCHEDPRRTCCEDSNRPGVRLSEKKACQGCVVLTPHKQTTPKPETQGKDSPPLGALPSEPAACAIDAISTSREPLRRPTSHAPPGETRSTPLLI